MGSVSVFLHQGDFLTLDINDVSWPSSFQCSSCCVVGPLYYQFVALLFNLVSALQLFNKVLHPVLVLLLSCDFPIDHPDVTKVWMDPESIQVCVGHSNIRPLLPNFVSLRLVFCSYLLIHFLRMSH